MQCVQSEFGEDAVFSGQRNRVGDRRNRNDFQKRRQQPRLISLGHAPFHQSLRQFESDASSAKALARILASRLIGIQHGQRAWHSIWPGQVMVGHDEIDAQPVCGFCGSEGTNTGIDADHEPNSLSRSLLNSVAAQIVAFFNAVGNVKIRAPATQLNRGFQDNDGGRAIHIVIAVNKDAFFALNRGVNPVHCSFHSGEQVWRVKMRQRWR